MCKLLVGLLLMVGCTAHNLSTPLSPGDPGFVSDMAGVVMRDFAGISHADVDMANHIADQDMAQGTSGAGGTGGGAGGTDGGTTNVDMSTSLPPPSCADHFTYCNGNTLVSCTNQHTIDHTMDCTDGDTNNPMVCADTLCYGGQSCCRRANPGLVWNTTLPVVESGAAYVTRHSKECASAPGIGSSDLSDVEYQTNAPSGPCSITIGPGNRKVGLVIDETKVTPGNYSLPNPAIYVFYTNGSDYTQNCSTWTGTANYISARPNWHVVIDATCQDPGRAVHLSTDLSGAQ
jgi:hypothetical protein